jgi:hypothetical protein
MKNDAEEAEVKKLFSLGDVSRGSYLIIRLAKEPTLTKQGSKVLFNFPATPELYQALQDYEAGALVEAALFAQTIRRLKSKMYAFKSEGNECATS